MILPHAQHAVATLLLALGIVLVAAPLPAATWEGIDVNMESNWPGCGSGGYFPVRITIVNRGQPRTLRFSFGSDYGSVPTVSRTIAVQTERQRLSLLIPCVGEESYGRVRVSVDGVPVPLLESSVTIPPSRNYDTQGPGVLLIDSRDADWTNFKAAVEQIVGAAATASGSYRGSTPSITAGDDHRYVAPGDLPTEWLAYTGLDIVVLPHATLDALPASDRENLLRWVDTGGVLLVYSLTQPRSDFARGAAGLDARLGFSTGRTGEDWIVRAAGPHEFLNRTRRFGLIAATPKNPFQEFEADAWVSLLNTVGRGRWEWTERFGFSAREPANDFLEFLIPSVRGVPVFAYLVLITLFSIAIGPVNYVYLWKQKRLYLLVVTIPAIALVTSASLFGYSVVAHGFATRSRVRSLTWLDQSTNTAVSASRVSLYSGLAPSGGLQFSRDTAVFPIWPGDGGFESGAVDWTERQHFASGWLRSRTRTQFFLITHRAERGRLEVTPAGEGLSLANGLQWPLTAILVSDDQGELHFGQNIAAGDAAHLKSALPADRSAFRVQLNAHPLQAPADASAVSYSGRHGRYGWYYGPQITASYANNVAERRLRQDVNLIDSLPPRSYIAILGANPGIDAGVVAATEEASLHVLQGNY